MITGSRASVPLPPTLDRLSMPRSIAAPECQISRFEADDPVRIGKRLHIEKDLVCRLLHTITVLFRSSVSDAGNPSKTEEKRLDCFVEAAP